MITGFANLYQQVRENVAKVREVKASGLIDQTATACVDNRTVQLCILDIVLAAHRAKYATSFNGLSGVSALHHKLLLKYRWPVNQIKEMTLSDSLLALHDELLFDNLPTEARSYFKGICDKIYPVVFPDVQENEWDPNLSAKFLKVTPE